MLAFLLSSGGAWPMMAANAEPVVEAPMVEASVVEAPMAEATLGASVDGLLAYARERNPEWIAMRREAEALAERAYPAGALPDPVLRVELQNVTNYGSDARPDLLPSRVGSTQYTLMQPLPFWGKLDLKRASAQAEAEAAQGKETLAWTEQAALIKTNYAQYFALSKLIRLTQDVLDLIGGIEQIAQARYAGGLTPQQDAIRAQVERTALRNELIQMETERHHLRSRLNALLARPAQAALVEPERLRALPSEAKLDYATLARLLSEKNPQLFSDEARIRAAENTRDLTYRNRYPDFTVGIAPMQTRNRVNEWELMVEFNIPLQQESRRSQEREAEKMLDAVRARKQASANRLLADLSENVSGLDAARRVEGLAHNSLLPQTELTYRAALAGYENGKVDFATLLDAQRQILKAQQDIIKAKAEQQARLAEIERLIGENL
ncbi:MAG TPA: TolC family protein [Rhodocyclaceae bacterium]|nr:TolC family protein [Rhodocyclaceae bacterium]